jgi:hypothetical protein
LPTAKTRTIVLNNKCNSINQIKDKELNLVIKKTSIRLQIIVINNLN